MGRVDYYHDPNAPRANSLVPGASAIVVNDEGRILLHRRSDNACWALPGGVMCADSKPAVTLALLQDWWTADQGSERDPTQDVIVLAGRRAEVDRLNTACQQLLAARGRLGAERLHGHPRSTGIRLAAGAAAGAWA